MAMGVKCYFFHKIVEKYCLFHEESEQNYHKGSIIRYNTLNFNYLFE